MNLLAVLVEYKGIPGVQGADGVARADLRLLGDWGAFLMSAQWPASGRHLADRAFGHRDRAGAALGADATASPRDPVLAWETERSGVDYTSSGRARRAWGPAG